MPGIEIRHQDQPVTVQAGATITGGQPVDADQALSTTNAASTVVPSAAGSKLCVGVALADAAPYSAPVAGQPAIAVPPPPTVSLARAGMVVPLTFSGASNFGDRLKTDGLGGVTPWIDGTDDPAEIMAINVNDTGPVAAGSTGYAALTVF